MTPLLTKDRQNNPYEFKFSCIVKHYSNVIIDGICPRYKFSAQSNDLNLPGSYYLTVVEVDNSLRVVELMNNYDPITDSNGHLKGKGIGIALLYRISQFFIGEITSSSNSKVNQKEIGEFRSDESTVFWNKLVSTGEARYCQDRHVYVFLPLTRILEVLGQQS